MSTFEIRVNGRIFTLWETASYGRSIDNLCGKFSFSSSNKIPEQYPVKKGDAVQIFLDKKKVLTGFVDDTANKGTRRGSFIGVSGRDKTSDIVDSSIPPEAKNIEGPVSLKAICEIVIKGLKSDIIVIVDPQISIKEFSSEELQAGMSAGNSFEFLNNFARKRQVYLGTNKDGNLIIYRPGKLKASTVIRHEKNDPRNNVKEWSSKNSDASRFNMYVARSQDNVGANDSSDYFGQGSSRLGSAIDDEIRESRYFEVICEESMSDQEALERAKEESNLRRARSFGYEVTLPDISQENGDLWQIGQIVTVRDFKCNIYGKFLNKAILLTQTLDGSNSVLNIAEPDAYNVIASLSKTDARKSKINVGF